MSSPEFASDLPQRNDIRGWMLLPLRRYAQFAGRSGRREFWWYSLFLALGYTIVPIVLVLPFAALGADDFAGPVVVIWYGLFFLANFIPGLALSVRRLHDLGLPGALMIVAYLVMLLLSVIGWAGYLVVMALPGQEKDNRYGPPVGEESTAKIFA